MTSVGGRALWVSPRDDAISSGGLSRRGSSGRSSAIESLKVIFEYRVDYPDGSYLLASQTQPVTYHYDYTQGGDLRWDDA